jgi:uncharacterized protein (TIGR00730 family)
MHPTSKRKTSGSRAKQEKLLDSCRKLLAELQINEDSNLAAEILYAAIRLAADHPGRADLKFAITALKELRYGFKVFRPYRSRRKVSVFGSARTQPSHPDYIMAMDFGRRIADAGYMVITGAGGGIMHAAHDGAGKDSSFGVAIKLPFEQDVNPIISGDEKLAYFRYFFSRKIMLVKETHAVVLFPGGFGTHDEAFEVLTLIQTGRANPMPVVMIEHPGSNYWHSWDRFIRDQLLAGGLISPPDTALWTITSDPQTAVNYITDFYRNYQSQRFVRDKLVLRIRQAPSENELEIINKDFGDLCAHGRITVATAAEVEPPDPPDPKFPRIVLSFNRQSAARLRMLIDRLNSLGNSSNLIN